MKSILLAVLSVLLASPSLAADRYVDCQAGSGGDGTVGNPWESIFKATIDASSGDVVHISNGPCPISDLAFKSNLNGSATGDCRSTEADCTIFKGDPTTVDVVPDVTNRDGIILSGISGVLKNIKLMNLNLTNDGTKVFDDPIIVKNGGMENVVLENVIVQGDHDRGATFTGGADGISGLLLDNFTVTATNGVGVKIQSSQVCTLNQLLPCADDSVCQPSSGTCEIGDIVDVDFELGTIGGNAPHGAGGTPICGGSVDGIVVGSTSSSTLFLNHVRDVYFNETLIANNGDDGLDIVGDFENFPNQTSTLLNVQSESNCKAGIRLWHSAHIENTKITNNTDSGIRTARVTSDTSTAKVNLINTTVANNGISGGLQINLGRRDYTDVKIFNTIGSSDRVPPNPVALKYSTTGTAFSLDWDYNVFHKTLESGCSSGNPCAHVIEYDSIGCNAASVPTCNGSHPNSQGAKPLFVSVGEHLQSSSPGFDDGKKPSTISGLSGITILSADTRDEDRHTRPRGAEYDIGAYEAAAGGGPGPGCS